MRYNITSKKIVGESLSADKDSAAKWIDFTLPTIINQYGENNIFNADELGLFYNQSAKQTFTEGSCSVSGIKQSKDRVSVLLAASMTGEKLCPLVIGKSKSPRCLKGKFLPTLYNHSKKSWMNAVIFNDYVKRLNEKMSISHRKIALIVDNCAAHSADSVNLSHVSLFYLPPNVTSIIQPMDAGIIKVFKHFYKCLFLRKKLAKVECGVATKITILEVLNMVEKAWKKVKKETIENCFKHAEWDPAKEKEKVIVNIEEDEMNEYNVLFEKLKTRDSDLFEITAEEFYQAEDHEITREILSEEEIVDSIISKSNVSEDEITEKVKVDEEGRKRKVKTIGEANKMWNMLKEFIEDKSPPKDSHKVINEVEDLLEKVAINNLIQPSLTDFNMFGTTDERDSHENTVGIKGDAGKEKKVKV
ncbi:putative tigger transposable element-derived protein 4 [Monocercomonoides exilis]|uniref:putative tigger transposable element-derived protein 4 n=1 Tax=Monocercomonoides exilis TaxID=2049356 RepID=UPI0035595705|nr:putative tigger transposable element-derived protein 4 [Monocercomonoides exilis]|eukprot:MONOS_9053.1-p1 / transcript=MONOS_9053.1 / gene=MONOS_9053 / organism=Monocercomonoides_exilis_PA203 / gene_product=putative tigger transposable element derived 6-like protein / transcript_product=putative tigger transposable element derived 6-like protein / location=Mono_scaffold00360:49345-50595(-) / protein_length=416 / sequence_SO=supercontig / SO=protein_coding / is_pseudo=false